MPVAGTHAAEGGTDARRWTHRGWLVAAAALVTWATFAVLRVWLPSVLQLLGPGPGPPIRPALVVLVAVTAPLPVALLLRRTGARPLWGAGVVVLAVGRVALQATDGGTAQLVLASVCLLGAGVALVALAAGTPSGHLARVGVVLGLGGEVVRHAVLGSVDLLWRDGTGAAVTVTVLAVALLATAARASSVPLWWPSPLDAGGGVSPVWTRGSALPWLGLGPALLLTGALVSPTARLELAVGLGPRSAVLALAAAAALAVAAAAIGPVLGPLTCGTLGAVLVVLATTAATRPVGTGAVLGQLGLLVAIGFVFGAPGTTPGDSGPRRRGGATAASLLLTLLLGGLSAVVGNLRVAVDDDAVLLAASGTLAVLALVAARQGRTVRPARDVPLRRLLLTATGLLAVGASGSLLVPPDAVPPPAPGAGGPVRVATYDVDAGFDADGRFDVDAVVAAVEATAADVLVLHDVDRGWLLTGGHDLLRLVATRTGSHATFVPGAHPLRGTAILSRHAVGDVRTVPLPSLGTAERRTAVSAAVDLGDGRTLAVLGAALTDHPDHAALRLAQARAVAAEAARLRTRGLPVAVLGALGAPLDAPELEPLRFLDDAAPRGGPTTPASAPTVRVDHVLVTADLSASAATVLPTTGSDHLPVAVTLQLPPSEGRESR